MSRFAVRCVGVLALAVCGLCADVAVAATVGANVNILRRPLHQCEEAIAINPTNPNNLVMAANANDLATGILQAYSMDAGVTWSTSVIADGNDSLIPACCDPTIGFDSFGNCFFGYLDSTTTIAVMALSTDGGKTFQKLASFPAGDQPTLVTGPGDTPGSQSVWFFFQDAANNLVATGARITGLGQVQGFSPLQTAPGSNGCNFGDIAIGPAGQVMIAYQDNSGGVGPSNIFIHVDADGLGPGGFGPQTFVTTTSIGGFNFIPPQMTRSVDAEVGLAWDRTSGAHAGRVYMVYTDAPAPSNTDLDIYLRYSDNGGASWSPRARVNDDATANSQFMPRIALDPTTGNIAFSWYDCRNDNGSGPGDTNGNPNDDVEFYATFSTDGGATFVPNFRVSTGVSNSADAADPNDFGDYTALSFYAGVFYPCWSDNSNSTGDNPDGALSGCDVYACSVNISSGLTPKPVITSPLTASGTVGIPFTYIITATGTNPIVLNAFGVPPGLINGGSSIVGTPTVAGTYTVILSATNAGGTTNQTLIITIAPGLPPTFTNPSSVSLFVGQPFSLSIFASGSQPIYFSVGALPSGVTFSLGYILNGQFATAGTYGVLITATNAVGTTQQFLTFVVQDLPSDGDADGDGVPNSFEKILGSNPFDPKSTPFAGNATSSGTRLFTLKHLDIKLGKNGDKITLTGALPMDAGYTVDKEQVIFLASGVVEKMLLGKSGQGSTLNKDLRVRISHRKSKVGTENASFSMTLQGSYKTVLEQNGFNEKSDANFPVYVLFYHTVFYQSVHYNALNHKFTIVEN